MNNNLNKYNEWKFWHKYSEWNFLHKYKESTLRNKYNEILTYILDEHFDVNIANGFTIELDWNKDKREYLDLKLALRTL